jgi:UDP-N-acetylglucosamine transferase subunit ALG13
MILVTLGTQKQAFTRLLDYIEKSNITDEIIVQAGHTKYESKKMKLFSFIDYDEMAKYVDRADIVITHGGTGSVVEPLKKGKKVIAIARLSKYGEHVDDHQTELVSIFADEGYILELKDGDNLDELIEKAMNFVPKKYVSNTDQFIQKLKAEIDK